MQNASAQIVVSMQALVAAEKRQAGPKAIVAVHGVPYGRAYRGITVAVDQPW